MDTFLIEGRTVQREGGRVHRPEARLNTLPEFRTVRGWPNEWDDPDTLLIAEDHLKLDWPVYFAITVEKHWGASWHVALHAVAPDASDKAVVEMASQLLGVSPEKLAEKDRPWAKVEALVNFGASATMADFYSEYARSAVLAARAEMIGVQANFPLYMDCPVNALGHTGWDFLRGFTWRTGLKELASPFLIELERGPRRSP